MDIGDTPIRVVIYGPPATGKTALAVLLKRLLEPLGHKVVLKECGRPVEFSRNEGVLQPRVIEIEQGFFSLGEAARVSRTRR